MSTAVAAGTLLLAALAASACRRAEGDWIPTPSLAGMEDEVEEALRAARADVEREPRSGGAWGRLGDHYFLQDFTVEAADCYARAEELDPGTAVWPYRQGLCRMADRPDLALAPLERCLESLDDYAPAHVACAQVLVRLQRLDEARAHFERATALDPKSPVAPAGLGAIALERDDLEAAQAAFEEALARDRTYVQAHVALARIYQALGQEKRAQRHAEQSRLLPTPGLQWDTLASPSLPPFGAHARTRFADQLAKAGQLDEADEQYRAAMRSDPSYYGACKGLADLLVARSRNDEAIELLRGIAEANPSFVQARRDLARLTGEHGGVRDPREADEADE